MSRDPLTDPRPGDVVKFVGATLSVQGICHGRVHYDVSGLMKSYVTLREWVRCMKTAEVLHVAQD